MQLCISLKIENKAKEIKTIDISMIMLTDSQGRTFDRSIDGQTAKGMKLKIIIILCFLICSLTTYELSDMSKRGKN